MILIYCINRFNFELKKLIEGSLVELFKAEDVYEFA